MLRSLTIIASLAVSSAMAGGYSGGSSDYNSPSYDGDSGYNSPSYDKPAYHPAPPPPPPMPSCETCYSWDGGCPYTGKYTPYIWVRKYNGRKCVDYDLDGVSDYYPDCNVVCCKKKKRPCPPKPKPKPKPKPQPVYQPPAPIAYGDSGDSSGYNPSYNGGSSGSNY